MGDVFFYLSRLFGQKSHSRCRSSWPPEARIPLLRWCYYSTVRPFSHKYRIRPIYFCCRARAPADGRGPCPLSTGLTICVVTRVEARPLLPIRAWTGRVRNAQNQNHSSAAVAQSKNPAEGDRRPPSPTKAIYTRIWGRVGLYEWRWCLPLFWSPGDATASDEMENQTHRWRCFSDEHFSVSNFVGDAADVAIKCRRRGTSIDRRWDE